MRGIVPVADGLLRECIRERYGIAVAALHLLPLGLDANAAVYRVVSQDGTPYFLKAKRGPRYEPAFVVPRSLRDHGIAAVVAPLPTKRHALWTRVPGWTVSLYPFIAGETGYAVGLSDAYWAALGVCIAQIHSVSIPASRVPSLRRETFSPTGYTRAIHTLEATHIRRAARDTHQRALQDSWLEHQRLIHSLDAAMGDFAHRLRAQAGPSVICHADLHPGNVLCTTVGHLFIIDWDDVMLAPKERDFIFVPGLTPHTPTPPFITAYSAAAAVDWHALAYYLCERAVQDIIECARQVFGGGGLADDVATDTVALFADLFSSAGEATSAWQAASSL